MKFSDTQIISYLDEYYYTQYSDFYIQVVNYTELEYVIEVNYRVIFYNSKDTQDNIKEIRFNKRSFFNFIKIKRNKILNYLLEI